MFSLIYQCKNCAATIPAITIDGRVVPPPDVCGECLSPVKDKDSRNRKRREPGAIFAGIQIVSKAIEPSEWVVQCLWCKGEPFIMKGPNIGNQNSCGCMRKSKLQLNYWVAGKEASINCTCKECGLTKEYNLLEEGPVTCFNGC
jgi:hypothetical protein